jgi:hypothetical protein
MTEVKFVKTKSGEFKGDITAVFPYEIATMEGDMLCYSHVGQHACCSKDWLKHTVLATPKEYYDLFRELISIGYDDLKIIKRIQYSKYLDAYYKL